jgi:tRNA1(Val) A37 N6-methylase TrmN6
MSHVGKIKAGFFATPELQGDYLTKLLEVKGNGTWLDPTCGEGVVLNQLATTHRTDNCTITTYGVELDKRRAEKASTLLNYCINAPIESMVIQNDAVSLLYLNPPYDFTMKGMDDESADRKEWQELHRNTRYLKEKGLMIYVIPSYRFADKRIARFLATHFFNVGIMRFSDEDYDDFRQCIFIGNKKSGKHKEFNQKLYDFLIQMESEDFVMEKVSPINLFVNANKKWTVPTGLEELKTFYTRLANKSDYVEGIQNSKGFTALINRSKPKQLEIGGNPILPLNQGQLGLLLASGAVNGEIGTGDNYHLVQGLEIVSKITEEEKKTHDNGSTSTVTKTRTKREISIKFINSSGLIRKLM